MLQSAGSQARVLVGGTDLLVGVRREPLQPLVLVDIKSASDLPPPIEMTASSVRFGPTATMSAIASDPLLAWWFPALVEASRVVGSVAIRNRASLIGNICHASPAADTAPALLVSGAIATIRGVAGSRVVPLSDFFVGPGETVCEPGELVVGLELAIPEPGTNSAFERLTRRRGVDLATVSVAASVGADGSITLGMGAVAPTPIVAGPAPVVDPEDDAEAERVAETLALDASPIGDIRAGSDYRRAMTSVLAVRAVRAARRRAASHDGRAA